MAYEIGKLVRADNSLNIAVGNALRIDEKAGNDNRTRIQRNSMMEDDVYTPFTFFQISIGENNEVTVGEGFCYYNLVALNIKEKKNALTLNKSGYLCLKLVGAVSDKASYVIEDDIPAMPVDGSNTVKFPIAKIKENVIENNGESGENTKPKKTYSVTQFPICVPPHLFAFGPCNSEK